jgi:alanine-glyoxylate transaminase/serine-glyoxylate transaminase/serine-pyruvate transaminase
MKGKNLLMIPGPIEFSPGVMEATGRATDSHVSPSFIEVFGESLEMMREVWLAPKGQPVILAGSGTLAMDSAGANLVEPGDKVLVISTGYFGDRYSELLKRYGAEVKVLNAPLGGIVDPSVIEQELSSGRYKLLTFTHVDTSTAVLVDPVPIGRLGRKYDVITVLDGVCSVAGEEIRQEEWGIDVVLTASQKAVGVPPGLALLVVSERALGKWKSRKSPVLNYYADWSNWLPVMQAYEARKPSYFGTPAVNLVEALNVSLKEILKEGMEARFARHRATGSAVRSALGSLGLSQVPLSEDISASTLSAPKYPAGVNGAELLKAVAKSGVIFAGGLHPLIKQEYFRIGHMGVVNSGDLVSSVTALSNALNQSGYNADTGLAVTSLLEVMNKSM